MGRWTNTGRCYGRAAIAAHWALAALLAALVALGCWMVRLPDVGYDSVKIVSILVHKQLGLAALALAGLRLAWRVLQPLPALAASLSLRQQVAARFVHLCFYALMFALPVSGWMMSSAAGFPMSFLGLVALPDLVRANEPLFRELALVHRWLAGALAALVALHAAAALRHHFVLGDDTLARMWRSS
jgi:cytochrome b561